MRLFRLGALVGSVVLLVATTVSMINSRSELRNEQAARVIASVLVADQSVESTIIRASAVSELANELTDPADLAESFGGDVSACIASGDERRCTDVDLFVQSSFGDAEDASGQSDVPAFVVDETTNSLLLVRRGGVTSALRIPVEALIDASAMASIAAYDARVEIVLSGAPAAGVSRSGPQIVDGRRIITDTIGLPDDGGSLRVTASIVDDVGLLGDAAVGFLLLLALGALLLALAGWTFLLDRRALERRATTDELTGLGNRREFERVAEEMLLAADRIENGICVMLIDLNGFKQINDTFGHQFGDLVLRAVAERLRSAVRDTDVVARWGGDEFVVMVPGIEDGTGVGAVAERIGRSLAASPVVRDVSITGAIGAALYPRHGLELGELLSAADLAMYSAKSAGVTYRLADANAVELAAEELSAASDYHGPDRRRHPSDTKAVSRN